MMALKKCPFCGSKANLHKGGQFSQYKRKDTETTIYLSEFKFGDNWFVECGGCYITKFGHSENEAVDNWNKRISIP